MKKILRAFFCVLAVCCMMLNTSCKTDGKQNKKETVLYVSTHGSDQNDGSREKPFLTLERARDAVRKIDKSDCGQITVSIEPGEYRVGSLTFSDEDSGTETCPVVYGCFDEAPAVLNGGITLDPTAFGRVEDEKMRRRLSASAVDHVICTDLTKLGLTEKDWGKLYAIGNFSTADKYDGDYVGDLYCELFVNDQRMTMARYPDSGEWLKTGKVIDVGQVSEFDHVKTPYWETVRNPKPVVYSIDEKLANRIAGWADFDDVWMFGYPGQDWADESSPIGAFDAEKRMLSPKFSSRYEPKTDAPYYFYNVFEELDAPGEFYLDRKTGMLYLYAPEDLQNAVIDLSLTTDPVITARGTHDIIFENLTVKGTRGKGIDLIGNRCAVRNCTVKNVADLGILLQGNKGEVSGCEICHTGKGGVELTGGNGITLEPGENVCKNCLIHDFGEIYQTYQAGVRLRGVGNTCAHNEIFRSPHMAVGWYGNDHTIEYNDIYEVCLQSDDAGALYSGKSWVSYGNVIRYNYIHDIGSENHSPSGIYLDDALSGHTVYGNVLVNIPANALFLGGGRDLDVRNNVIIGAGNAISYDQRAIDGFLGDWFTASKVDGVMWQNLKETPYTKGEWKEKYPQMQKFNTDYSAVDDPNFPPNPAGSTVSENIIFNDDFKIGPISDKVYEFSKVDNNPFYITEMMEELFRDPKNGDYRFREDAPVFEDCEGIKAVPFDQIGRQKTSKE